MKKKQITNRKTYAAIINEAHKPKMSKKKQQELEALKKSIRTKTRLE